MTGKEGPLEKDTGIPLSTLPVNRREFLKRLGVLGGGIIVYFTVGDSTVQAALVEPVIGRIRKGDAGRRRRECRLGIPG